MRIINLKATPRELLTDTRFAGYEGEHKGTQLVIRLDEDLRGMDGYYLRFCTATQVNRGGMSITGKLNFDDNIVLFALPRTLTREGVLRVQLVCERDGKAVFTPTLRGGLDILPLPDGVTLPPYTPEPDGLTTFFDISDYMARRSKYCAFLKRIFT